MSLECYLDGVDGGSTRMQNAWNPALLKKVPLTVQAKLTRVTRDQGARLIAELGLSPQERETVLSICPASDPALSGLPKGSAGPETRLVVHSQDPWRQHKIAVLWALGASQYQLAGYLGIHRTTLRDILPRVRARWPTLERVADRVTDSRLTQVAAALSFVAWAPELAPYTVVVQIISEVPKG